MDVPLISLLREGDQKPSFVGLLQRAVVLGLYRPFFRPCTLYTFASRYCYYCFTDGEIKIRGCYVPCPGREEGI